MRALGLGFSLVLLGAAVGSTACSKSRVHIRAERPPNQLESDRSDIVIVTRGMTARPPEPEVHSECEPGQRMPCWSNPQMGPSPGHMLYAQCRKGWDGGYHWSRNACNTPLVVSFDAQEAIHFTRPAADAALFTVGVSDRTEWVSASTPWLAIDADGSGCIEGQSELFGSSPRNNEGDTNGFHKLARLDDNHDGRIDDRDPAFASLVLWSDVNQDRRCTPSEVKKLADAGVVALDLGYSFTSEATKAFESYEGEHASMWFRSSSSNASTLRQGRLVDVYLAPIDQPAD